jgi:hypothetical protein
MKKLTTKNYNKNRMVDLIEQIRIDLLDIEKNIKVIKANARHPIENEIAHNLKLAIEDSEELRDMVKNTLPYSNKFFKDSIK